MKKSLDTKQTVISSQVEFNDKVNYLVYVLCAKFLPSMYEQWRLFTVFLKSFNCIGKSNKYIMCVAPPKKKGMDPSIFLRYKESEAQK